MFVSLSLKIFPTEKNQNDEHLTKRVAASGRSNWNTNGYFMDPK